MVIYLLCEALHFHAGNARIIILHKMTNYHLCMNPVKTSIMVAVRNVYVDELTC